MLCKPTLLKALVRGDPQREALLSEKSVAAYPDPMLITSSSSGKCMIKPFVRIEFPDGM